MSTKVRPAFRFRWLWLVIAYLSLVLGVIGAILPVVPTVPFVLLAAFAAARGSTRLHIWVLTNPSFGPMIRDWERYGAVSRRAKIVATLMMAISAVLMLLAAPKLWIAALGTGCMACVAVWLWCRPEPVSGQKQQSP